MPEETRVAESGSQQADSLLLNNPEPWPDPVDGAALLNDLGAAFTRYVALTDGAADALALWVLHTFTHDACVISPILAIVSPEKRCGKTTLVSVLSHVVARPLPSSNITPAVVFRAVQKYRPTLLIDEADTFLRSQPELVGILNSGHTRAGAAVIRTVGDAYEPTVFSTWAPKAIAMIGSLPPTLEDRSVSVRLRRRLQSEPIQKLRMDRIECFETLRRKAVRWAADNLDGLRSADPDNVPSELHDRAADNWRPLLAIADAAGGAWPDKARRSSLLLSASGNDSDVMGDVRLLADIRSVLASSPGDRIESQALANQLTRLPDADWSEFNNGKGISTNTLARKLRPFGITPRDLWIGSTEGKTRKGYRHEDFFDVFRRYLPPETQGGQGASSHA